MTKRNLGIWAVVVGGAVSFQGCAHRALEKRVDAEIAQESSIKTRGDLNAEVVVLIRSAPGLTDDQRSRLTVLSNSTRTQSEALGSQSFKLRSVLIKEMISTHYDRNEVELLKKKLKSLEDQRLALIFSAVEQANHILGREAANNRRVMETMWESRMGRD